MVGSVAVPQRSGEMKANTTAVLGTAFQQAAFHSTEPHQRVFEFPLLFYFFLSFSVCFGFFGF